MASTSQSTTTTSEDQEALSRAASLIQKNYRSHVSRREASGLTLSADRRWTSAMQQHKVKQAGKESKAGEKMGASDRWKRGGVLVGQLAGGNDGAGGPGPGNEREEKGGGVEGGPSLTNGDEGEEKKKIGDVPGGEKDGKIDNIKPITKRGTPMRLLEYSLRGQEAQELSKVMEAQYWLEMVDKYHRYGSNLKPYHQHWSDDASIKDNFFKWLDDGAGKDLDLEECPRERLERERITYLSAEQRANYVVDIKEGKLIWRRNGKPVDTTKGKHKDLGHGQGIVDLSSDEMKEIKADKKEKRERRGSSYSSSSSSSSSSESSSDLDSEEEKEQEDAKKRYGADDKKKGAFTSKGWQDALMRKTVGANTWIYVLNARKEFYVGIKQTGKFQHSSFMFGSKVLSAGLLKASDGTLTSLSPLSGHYRAGTSHFRYFISQLQAQDVDLSRVKISKSLLLLAGMEKYASFKKGGKGRMRRKDEKTKKEMTKIEKVKEKVDEKVDEKMKKKDGKEKDGMLTRMMEKLNPHSSKGEAKKENQDPTDTPAPALA